MWTLEKCTYVFLKELLHICSLGMGVCFIKNMPRPIYIYIYIHTYISLKDLLEMCVPYRKCTYVFLKKLLLICSLGVGS
jgi:hypothetical protein